MSHEWAVSDSGRGYTSLAMVSGRFDTAIPSFNGGFNGEVRGRLTKAREAGKGIEIANERRMDTKLEGQFEIMPLRVYASCMQGQTTRSLLNHER